MSCLAVPELGEDRSRLLEELAALRDTTLERKEGPDEPHRPALQLAAVGNALEDLACDREPFSDRRRCRTRARRVGVPSASSSMAAVPGSLGRIRSTG